MHDYFMIKLIFVVSNRCCMWNWFTLIRMENIAWDGQEYELWTYFATVFSDIFFIRFRLREEAVIGHPGGKDTRTRYRSAQYTQALTPVILWDLSSRILSWGKSVPQLTTLPLTRVSIATEVSTTNLTYTGTT